MSTTGTVTVRSTKHTTLLFTWNLTGQNAAENTSTLSWQMCLAADAYGRINSSSSKAWSVTIGGQTFSGRNYIALNAGQTLTLASGTATVAHDADGTCHLTFSFSQEFSGTFSDVYVGTVTGSGTGDLPLIPRASTLEAGEGTFGAPMTIRVLAPADAFTHTLRYAFGEESGTIAENVTGSAQWTPPLTLATQIPRKAAGTATLFCDTYASGTLLGTTSVSVTLNVPASVAPTVTAVWSDTTDATALLGAPAKNFSALRVELTATEAYGSPVVSRAIVLEGTTYSRSVAITNTLTTAGTVTLTVTATDARGHTGSRSYAISVLDYAAPTLTLSASRCLADGTADDTGEYATVTVTGYVSPVGGNTGTTRLTYGSTTVTLDMSAASGAFTARRIIPASSTATVSLSATLTDKLTRSKAAMTLSTGFATMDFLSGGRGIAFGKTATREGFDCAMPAYFSYINDCVIRELRFDTNTSVSFDVNGRCLVLMGIMANSGQYALYILAVRNATTLTAAQRIAGTLELAVTLDNNVITVTGAPNWSYGWYIV